MYEARIARGAHRTPYNGRTYASKSEAAYARQLDMLKAGRVVAEWKPQQALAIAVNGLHITRYVADFWVRYTDGREEWVDVKGKSEPTDLFQIKRRLVRAVLGIEVRVV